MRIFVWEFVAGGGWFHVSEDPPGNSLLREGQAMAAAVCRDLCRIDSVDVRTTHDARLTPFWKQSEPITSAAHERERFDALTQEADRVLLIAPELDRELLSRTERAEAFGAQLLNPDSDFIRLTMDKTRCCDHLRSHGVPVPRGGPRPPTGVKRLIRKPNLGAGSTGVQLVDTFTTGDDLRWEEFIPGEACSVAIIGRGAESAWICPPFRQHVAPEQDFLYSGGSRLMEPPKVQRALSLARSVVQALPTTEGYFGIDLVLGKDPTGRQDVVLEVNPRLTTSYLGLRQLTHNLAQHFAQRPIALRSAPSWSGEDVRFEAGEGG